LTVFLSPLPEFQLLAGAPTRHLILTKSHLALPYNQGSTAASTQFDNYFSLKGAWMLPFLLCLFYLTPRQLRPA